MPLGNENKTVIPNSSAGNTNKKYQDEQQITTPRNLISLVKSMADSNNNCYINYLLPGPNREADKRASVKLTKLMHYEFPDFFFGIGCFSLQVKEGSKPYQVPSRCVGYALQNI